MATEDLEVNYRLDDQGRTAPTEGEKIGVWKAAPLDYDTRAVQATFVLPIIADENEVSDDNGDNNNSNSWMNCSSTAKLPTMG
jgi:hypothetical protein